MSSHLKGNVNFIMGVCLAVFLLTSLSQPASRYVQSRPEASAEAKITFDPFANPALTSKLSDSGDILVRPLLNDKEVGWFLLDPAVEGMRIVPSLAEDLGLAVSGSVRLITATKAEERQAWQCPKFQLGPLLAEGLEMTEMKAGGGEEEAVPIAGVVGTTVLRAVTAEVEFDSGAVRFFEPSSYPAPAAPWQEFKVQHSLPVILCRFEGDREGEFGFDLRSPLGIVFFRPKVQALGLLENRVTKPAFITGTNFGRASVRTGVLEWFEAAGLWLSEPQAVFLTQDINLPAAGDLAGLLGRQALQDGTLVLDYSRSRLAIVTKR